jgi:hypothetical protein
MTHDDLDRVRDDLAAIRSAAGLESAWGRRDLRTNLWLATAGLVAAGWALAPHGFWPVLGLLAFLAPVAEWLRSATSGRADGYEAERVRRDVRDSIRTLWLALPILALYAWCRHVGLPPLQFLGLAAFLVGSVLFMPAIGERANRPFLGWAVALMMGGLLVPLGVAPVIAVVAGAISLGGLTSAAIVTLELRRGCVDHDAG